MFGSKYSAHSMAPSIDIHSRRHGVATPNVIRHRRERMDKKIFINCWRAQKLEA